MKKLKRWAKKLKRKILLLSFAYRDRRTPWYAKIWMGFILLYALSPIDLIPDFIPLLGMIDDLILIPLFIVIALRLVPREVKKDAAREAARQSRNSLKKNSAGVALVLCFWAVILLLILFRIFRR